MLNRIVQFQKNLERDRTTLDLLTNQRQALVTDIDKLQSEITENQLLQLLLEDVSTKAREAGKMLFEQTATNALQMVVGEEYSVELIVGKSNNLPTIDVELVKSYATGTIAVDPTDDGGGLSDLVSLSNFVSLGMLTGEENVAPHFLDEPTKYVSKGHGHSLGQFFSDVAAYTNKQTFLVTHDENVANVGDSIFMVEIDEGVSNVTALKK